MRLLRDGLRYCLHGARQAGDVLQQIASFPIVDLSMVTNDRPLLVLAPHPDDESLGCGGLIAEACARGHRVHVAVLTDGAASHPGSRAFPPQRLRVIRREETQRAAAALGLPPTEITFLDLPDGAAPLAGSRARAVAHRVADIARDAEAETIVATWQHDTHRDHLAAYRAARGAAAITGARLLFYPIWSYTLPAGRWLPALPFSGFRLDIARHLDAKRRAVAAHRSQVGDLVGDDANGFRLHDDVIQNFLRPTEAFIEEKNA
jgi:LmbE family N-acetylglucosaminyl deacetylase